LVATAAEPGRELSRVDPVTTADADLGHAWAGFFEKDGELLVADGVELIDGTVRLVGRRTTVPQCGLADRAPDEAVAELVMQTLQDPALHSQRRCGPAAE